MAGHWLGEAVARICSFKPLVESSSLSALTYSPFWLVKGIKIGGGFFPPVIGLGAGAAGILIRTPPSDKSSGLTRFAAKLWPWPLVILVAWPIGQFPVGYFFNDFLKSIIGFGLLLIVVLLPLPVYTARARDSLKAS